MKPQALIFDVDGTLAETERDGHLPAFNHAFKQCGLSWEWSVATYGQLLAITGGKERMRYYAQWEDPHTFARTDFDALIKTLHRVKTEEYMRLVAQGKTPLREGVAALIHQARSHNIPLAIATTTTMENVTALLTAHFGQQSHAWFCAIGAGDMVSHKKPAPDIYQWVLSSQHFEAGRCLAFEDSANGLKSAMASGIPTIITPSFYTQQDDFSGALEIRRDLSGFTFVN